MAIAYKNFLMTIVDAETKETIETVGSFEISFVSPEGSIYSSDSYYNQSQLIKAIDTENSHRSSIRGAMFGIAQDSIDWMHEVLPSITAFDFTYIGGLIKLTADNGFYALPDRAGGQLFLYDDNDVYRGVFPFTVYWADLRTSYVVVPDFDGELQANTRCTVHTIQTRLGVGLQGYAVQNEAYSITQDIADWFNAIGPAPEPPTPGADPYDGEGEDDLPGGEIIGLPNEPTLSPIDAGLFSLYSPTTTQMRNLADYLWTDFGGSGTTVEQVLEEVVEALKRSISNPLNSMLGLSIIASQGLSKGTDSSVHIGFWNTGVSMTKLTKQYFSVDCGSLSFNPVCGNTFLDYAPYSRFMIYLPYVGMRLLDANDVVGHTISVKYRGDCVSGALTCYIIRDGSVIQEHTGNCALNIPLTADSWAETISSVSQIISGTVAGGAIGGGSGAAAGAVRGAASVATNPSAFSPQVTHTGAVSGAAGHLGSQKPFILREAVRFHSTAGFNGIIGYPSYYYRKLGDCSGFTQCLEVHLSHTPATGDELQEIEELLKKGVII